MSDREFKLKKAASYRDEFKGGAESDREFEAATTATYLACLLEKK